ncbi:hypothetical protein ACHAXN_012180 [Cyclotella atomus]
MHQRRRAPIANGPASSQTNGQPSSIISHNRGSRNPKSDVLSTLLWLFLLSLIFIEFYAYKSFDMNITHQSSPPIPVVNLQHNDVNNHMPPTKQPAKQQQTRTFSPTPQSKGFRIKSARRDSHRNSFYWKTHTPDEVPPLPPDVDENGNKLPPIVAYVVALTKCKSRSGSLDGAAILLHSIRRNSYGWTSLKEQMDESWPLYGGNGGRYRYRAYVIVDPEASPNDPSKKGDCARYLQKLGYIVLHRAPLVPLFPITDEFHDMSSGGNEFFQNYKNSGYLGSARATSGPMARSPDEREDTLRIKIHNDGCCGYTETLKLHVYGLVEHPLAVHLDLDSLLLRPMDDLFDAMLGETSGEGLPLAKGPKTKTPDYSRPIDAAFTRDYNQVNAPSPEAQVGYQGGFLAVRPSLEVLERYRDILKRGEFVLNPVAQKRGWGGKFGAFYGSLTFQGLVPYYYEEVAPKGEHNEMELDRCRYNQMADNPRKSTYKFPRATPLDPDAMGFRDTKKCRDGREDCSDTDCQRVHPKDTVTTHFTFCKKPWDCSEGLPGTVADDTCKGLLREWFAIRRELEDWWMLLGKSGKELSYSNSKSLTAIQEQRNQAALDGHYLGYCKFPKEYLNLVEPNSPEL